MNDTPVDYYHSGHVAVALGLKEAWATLKGLLAGYRLARSHTDSNWVPRNRFENLQEAYRDLLDSARGY